MKKETIEIIKKCLKFPGGRSRPDKSFPFIGSVINALELPKNTEILDVGCGRGSFGYILNTEYNRQFFIDGVEIYPDYIDRDTKAQYREVIFSDFTKTYKDFMNYDVYLMVDVIEHFEKDKAIEIINFLIENDKIVIASIPNAPKHWHQSESFEAGNIHEKHLYNWNNELVRIHLGLYLVGEFEAIGVYTNA